VAQQTGSPGDISITHDPLAGGTLKRYIGELPVTGLTSNPTIFDHASILGLLRAAGLTWSISMLMAKLL
jgi:transaldolase